MKKLVLLIALMISYQAVSQKVSYVYTGANFRQININNTGKVFFYDGQYKINQLEKNTLNSNYQIKLIKKLSNYPWPILRLDVNKNLIWAEEYYICNYSNDKINQLAFSSQTKGFDVGSDGVLWFDKYTPSGDNIGLTRSSDMKSFTSSNSNILQGQIKLINCDRKGNVWILLNSGLSKFDGKDFTNFTTSNSNFPKKLPTTFVCDSIGNLWFGSTEGLTKFDGTTWTNYTTANSTLVSNNITTLALDHDFTSIWIGTEDGISHFDGKNWKTYTSTNSNLPTKLNDLSMSADTNGNLWFSNEDQNGKYPLSVLCKNFKQNLYNQVLIKKPICPGDGFVLSAPTGAANYYWSSGENTAQIQTKTPGDYNVLMYDDSGCPYMSQTLTILASDFEMNTPSICLVTNQGKYNKVVWEQLNSKNVKTYNIYKQNKQNSKYEFFKSQDANNMTEFIDSLSEASSQIDRYALSYTDTCGNESKLSSIHTTLLLSSNLGSNGTVNLAWNAYEGFSYQNFEIWRSSDGKNFNLLAYAANNTFAFIDNNPPQTAYYQVRVQNAITCNPSKRGVNTAISNTVDKDGKSINLAGLSDFTESNFIIYPNPTNNLITVSNLKSNSVISITDLNGRKIYEEIVTADKIEIPLNELAEKGIYFINLIEKGIKINAIKIILE